MDLRHPFQTSIVAALSLLTLAVPCQGAPPVIEAAPSTDNTRRGHQELLAAVAAAEVAQIEVQDGRPAAYKALWWHSDEVTLTGGFGGGDEKGWTKVGSRLDWAAAQFSNVTNTIERLVTHSNEAIGYVVQVEDIRYQIPGQTKEATRDYRVTGLYVLEPEGWKIVHRHADAQTIQQASQ